MSEPAAPPEARAVTHGPNYHFFGYYDKFPWDPTGELMLGLETRFQDRPPKPEDEAVVGLIHTGEDYRWDPLIDTQAWNWQQGSMQQWLNVPGEQLLIHNYRKGDRYVALVHDIRAGSTRTLPRPIYAVSQDARQAVTLNFSRVHRLRPGYGYNGVPDRWEDDPAPAEDGIYWMDLQSGESRLIVSLAEIVATEPDETMDGAMHRFNHLQFNTDGTRFLFLHRWYEDYWGKWYTRMFTANPDGSDLHWLIRSEHISHFDWYDRNHVLCWSTEPDHGGAGFFLYTDQSDEIQQVGAGVMLPTDGHCSYSPDRKWILNDAYPKRDQGDHERPLYIYSLQRDRRYDLGRFYSPPELDADYRCDLHPRWNRDGTQICFDSAHQDNHRQMYLMNVADIVRG